MMEGNQDQLMCSKDESLFVPVPNRLNCYTVRPSLRLRVISTRWITIFMIMQYSFRTMISLKIAFFIPPLGLFCLDHQISKSRLAYEVKNYLLGCPNIFIFMYLYFLCSKILCYEAPKLHGDLCCCHVFW